MLLIFKETDKLAWVYYTSFISSMSLSFSLLISSFHPYPVRIRENLRPTLQNPQIFPILEREKTTGYGHSETTNKTEINLIFLCFFLIKPFYVSLPLPLKLVLRWLIFLLFCGASIQEHITMSHRYSCCFPCLDLWFLSWVNFKFHLHYQTPCKMSGIGYRLPRTAFSLWSYKLNFPSSSLA